MKKKLLLILSVLCMALTYCAKESSIETAKSDQSKNFIFVCPIVGAEYWKMCIEGIKQADSELGTNTTVIGPLGAENFIEDTVSFMNDAISQNPDGIIVYAGIEDLYPLIDHAEKSGIPVIAVDSDASDSLRTAFVGPSDYSLGYTAGKEMIGLMGESAKLGIMVTSKTAEREMNVLDTFFDVINDYPIEVVAIEESAHEEKALVTAEKMLTEHPEINAVFSTGTTNVTAVGKVKKKLGIDELALVGFDDSEENIELVRDGIIDKLIVQQPKQMGYESVYLMNERLENGSLAKEIYDTGSVVVDKSNVDSYTVFGDTESTVGETVRIGYYSGDPAFQYGFDNEQRKSGYAYEYYQAIATYTGWNYKYVYGTRSEIMDKLISGEVDIAAGVYKTSQREEQMLFSNEDMGLENEERYFAISTKRADLKRKLDDAMDQIMRYSPDLTTTLRNKYYADTTYHFLSDNEKSWLKNRGALTLGYIRSNLPYCDIDENGEPIGVVNELKDYLKNYMNTDIELKCFDSVADMEDELLEGRIDAAFPIYSDLWLSESKGIRQTVSFISDRSMVVFKDKYTDETMSRLGICRQSYSGETYDVSELVYYNSLDEMFSALSSGKEKCIVGSASIMQHFMSSNLKYKELNVAYLDRTEEFGMAVRQDDVMLASILNKAVNQMNSASITNEMIRYSTVEPSYSFSDFVSRNFSAFILLLAIALFVVITFFALYFHKTRIFNKKQAETHEALEKALEASKVASQAKTDFLSSMSHDIRTPMNAIFGMARIASENIDNRDKVKNCLEKIDISSRHLLTLINDILDISKIESNKLPLNPVSFSIRSMTDSLIEIIRPQLEEKNLKFTLDIHDIDTENVYADEVRVNQIYINILSNAVKYTPDNGSIVMELYEESVKNGETVRVVCVVRDTGIGMTPEFMENMYSVFSRAQDSRTNKIQGTGLGLSIVKRLVDMMNGTIECKSVINKGTKFKITLDMSAGENSGADMSSDSEQSENELKGKHLLIAEDNDINWEVDIELLDMYGITADRAENGRICIDMLNRTEEGKYDAVLMDIQMPVMNGREASREIRQSSTEWVRNIPIIAMTADAFAEDIAACEAAGMNAHIAKPVDMEKLCRELCKLLKDKNN